MQSKVQKQGRLGGANKYRSASEAKRTNKMEAYNLSTFSVKRNYFGKVKWTIRTEIRRLEKFCFRFWTLALIEHQARRVRREPVELCYCAHASALAEQLKWPRQKDLLDGNANLGWNTQVFTPSRRTSLIGFSLTSQRGMLKILNSVAPFIQASWLTLVGGEA